MAPQCFRVTPTDFWFSMTERGEALWEAESAKYLDETEKT
jgi:hypothetical protein